MKRFLPRAVRALLFCSLVLVATAQTYTWTGIGNGWKNQSAPTGSGTENLVFGSHVSNTIPIPSATPFSINSAAFVSDDRFLFVPQSASSTLNIAGGGISASNMFGGSTTVDFASGITVNLTGSQIWDFGHGGGVVMIHGVLGGSGNLTLTGNNSYNSLTLLLANPTANSSSGYSGNITLGNSTVANLMPTLALWASGNLGSGSLTFVNGGQLITHNATDISNNLVLNSGPLPGGNNNSVFTPVNFKAWDAPMTVSGAVTLANHTTINAQLANPDIQAQFPGDTGSWPLAGPRTRHPIIFSGHIGESTAGTSLNITGPGIVILAGNNSLNAYSGGTNVGFQTGTTFNQQGTLIFANQGAIPITGSLQSGLLNTPGASGYIGIADTAVSTAGAFNSFLNKFTVGSMGAVGLDSLDGTNAPNATPHAFSDNIDLFTHFGTPSGNMGIRLGTATSIILTGSITPQLSTTYHFGNGGGRMYVQTALANQPSDSTGVRTENQGAIPLQLFLQGANTYTGGTTAINGFIIFDGASSVPASGSLLLGGSATVVGNSYLGFTNAALGSSSVNGSAATGGLAETGVGLFGKFDKANSWGIIGFDSTVPAAPTTVTNLDLTGFNNGVFVGTNSAAVLSGTITPTADNNYRFTASNGGKLTVASTLTNPASGVVLGSFSGTPGYSDGTITLSGANAYGAGTLINTFGNLSVEAGNAGAFGTGAIYLQPSGGVLGLSTGAGSLVLPNAITFSSSLMFPNAGTIAGGTPTLSLTGNNGFTLAGNITGPDRTQMYTMNDVGQGLIALYNTTPISATISGDNSGFYGTFMVVNGTMTFAGNTAPGRAQVEILGGSGTVAFTSPNPVVYGLTNSVGGGGTVNLGAGTNLTVDTTNTSDGAITGQGMGNYDFDFGGAFVGDSSTKLTVFSTINSNVGSDFFYVYGSSPSFTGNVYVTGQSALALGRSDSVGTGTITLNAVDGGLALNTGVTLTNPLVFNTGALAGIGTFQPSNVSGTGQTADKITFGASQFVYPGIPGENAIPGQLTLATNVAFANGGEFVLVVQDPATAEGYGRLSITGSLDLNSISTAGFTFDLESLDAQGNTSPASTIVYGNSYSLLVISATGGLTGFDAAKFSFDVSKFQNGMIPASAFSVSADANHLYLNFTAVPEPSTWALLITGAGFLGLAALRRRRA